MGKVKFLLAMAAVAGLAALSGAPVAAAANLPDGRGYELASPELNNAAISPALGSATTDGRAVQFITVDAPVNAQAGTVTNAVVARRGPNGWTTEGVTPKLVEPAKSFFGFVTADISKRDLGASVAISDQNLTANPPTPGKNLYYRTAGGGIYTPITRIGNPNSAPWVIWESADFSHVYFQSLPQLPEDPVAGEGNTYEWTTQGDLRLFGVLPGPLPSLAPNGGTLAVPSNDERPPLDPVSADGQMVLWHERTPTGQLGGVGPLYLRERAQRTVEVSASQRTVEPDPNPLGNPIGIGVAEDGSAAYFTSSSELTNDAYTGRTGGVANDAGSDLYRYDVATEHLTDLTVDTNAADAATGAQVTRVLGATPDASYIYFIATGNLAAGAASGVENLYVEHSGEIRLIASSPAIQYGGSFYVTPDGRHAAMVSTASLTGYDNVSPLSGAAEPEAFLYTFGGGLECASCRPDGEPPTGAASFAAPAGGVGSGLPSYLPRTVSDDGSRMFFQSTDAVLPGATNELRNVYEYEGGQVHLISSGTGISPSTLVDASGNGDDVFFVTHDELAPVGSGRVSALYDARVGAATSSILPPADCSGEGCRGAAAAPPPAAAAGSKMVRFAAAIAVYGRRVVKGSRAKLAISVPAGGRIQISGKGLRSLSREPGGPGVVRVALSLVSRANRVRRGDGAYATSVRVVFRSASGGSRQMTLGLEFLSNLKKGGK